MFDRRTVVAGVVGVAVAPMGERAALAQAAPSTYGSISVDVAPLRASGLGGYADQVRAALEAELRQAFADRLARGGARLVVRVDAISLRAYAGSGSSRFGGSGMQSDYLEGEALVLGRRGEVLLRHPQLSAVPSSSGGAWYLPDSEGRRLVALAGHFAGWLRRALG
ncbi:hypothetical protein [uncultured Enterovirga sp.]|uniref:hypothetical protein n=1 Tax=uncultured Enterovirga sp. TaxID=2026352 RepID=UPI0035C9F6A9